MLKKIREFVMPVLAVLLIHAITWTVFAINIKAHIDILCFAVIFLSILYIYPIYFWLHKYSMGKKYPRIVLLTHAVASIGIYNWVDVYLKGNIIISVLAVLGFISLWIACTLWKDYLTQKDEEKKAEQKRILGIDEDSSHNEKVK